MGLESAAFEAVYRRSHGTHKLTTLDDTPVTAVSASEWGEFQTQLEALPTTSGLIISPELMTIADNPWPVLDLGQNHDRLETVREISQDHPEATIVVGGIHQSQAVLHNSTFAFQSGQLMGRIDKGWLTALGVPVFKPGSAATRPKLLSAGKQVLICSELFGAIFSARDKRGGYKPTYDYDGIIDANIKTAVLSACWGVPPEPGYALMMSGIIGKKVGSEEYYCSQLEKYGGYFFKEYPQVDELIVVDRAVPDSQILPFNARFRRTTS